MPSKEQIEMDIRQAQIDQLVKETAQLRMDLRTADSRAVEAKVLLSDLLWSMANINLAEVKFEKAKGKGWKFIRGEGA